MATTDPNAAANEQIRDQQRDVWNTFSAGWKKQDDFVVEWLRPVGTTLIEQAALRDGDVALDAATGTGEPGLSAAARVGSGKVVGVDISEQMVVIAAEKARQKGISNYEARVTDESALPFADASFDAVLCRFGVMFFPDPPRGVRELARVLKPGRRLALAAWAEPQKNAWATTASRVVNELLALPAPPPDAPGIFRHAAPGLLSSLLDQAGLHDAEVTEVTGEATFESPEAYWVFITDVVAPVATALKNIDAPQREAVKQAVLAAAAASASPGSTEIRLPWSALVASATK
ncbi:MAG: methyltransferase domain-containing protein [Dehalococcoidia bacterium]|nr:MAG: methyltransferase domain-containing protein [Dehalococcoidia bacterium]